MYDLHLTEEQLEIRDTVRDFVRNEIKPLAVHPNRLEPFEKPLLTGILESGSKMGLRTLSLSDEHGGAGADNLTSCLVIEALAAGDIDVAVVLAHTSLLGHVLFDELMTAEQRARFLPQFMDDHACHLAYAGRDREAGLAPHYHRPVPARSATQVTGVKQANGDWIIDGVIAAVPNAPIAKLFAVEVGTQGTSGMTALLVPRETAGLTVQESVARAGGPEAPIRWHHGSAGKLVFKNCRVPANNLLGSEGQSALGGRVSLTQSAPQFSAANLGVGQAAYEAAVDQAKLRRQGGRPIIEHQAIGTLLAEITIKLEAARNLVWKAAWALDHPDAVSDRSVSGLPLHHIARAFTSEMMHAVTERAAECFGAMGVMRDMPMQKYVGDALVFMHGDIGNSAAKLLIAEAVAGYERTT
jgi:alkylation response protein AidB-like acyl-CoA dehydrogenase